jgi:hypothetical protein
VADNIISTGFVKKIKLNTTRALDPDSVKQCLAAFKWLLGSGAKQPKSETDTNKFSEGLTKTGNRQRQ